MKLTSDLLISACHDDARDGGITIHNDLVPLAGNGSPVKPATYAGSRFQSDRRWHGTPPEPVDAIVIDNVPSQANRLEKALRELRADLGLPEIVLDLSSIEGLPPHLPRSISSFQFPHRQADAYLRDCQLDGKDFAKTTLGVGLLNATVHNPDAMLAWFPQALLFGYWQSHLGSKRSQAKLARSWVSEIVGYEPATGEEHWTRVLGVKGDPLNLSVDEQAEFNDKDLLGDDWTLLEGTVKGSNSSKEGGVKKKALSEIGHGQVPFRDGDGSTLAAVSFGSIDQLATVSFAGLRRIWGTTAADRALARALVASLGLVAHATEFGRTFSLRSGCDLKSSKSVWQWIGEGEPVEVDPLNANDARELFLECRDRALAVGIGRDGGWKRDPLIVTPSKNLRSAIEKTWPLSALPTYA